MKISINWLAKFVNISETPSELAEMLTMLGFEAEVCVDFSTMKNIVSAIVISTKKHPNADKLKLCQVFDGKDELQIVCGAPNVQTGQSVILAKIGSILPGDFKIKKSKIRGEESYGMICSERELGLSDEHEGIMTLGSDIKPGLSISDVLNPVFSSLELDISPNRPDALSHLGIAREISVKTNRSLQKPKINPNVKSSNPKENIEINIEDQIGCPRYIAGVVKNVSVGPSPGWMEEALKSAGMRPINNLVDISNYVLLEMGHPTHIFDFGNFPTNTVQIKRAKKGEKFVTLDEEEHILNSEHLLITNGKDPVALAGIMGGLQSAVSEKTKTVLIESAYFDPVTIRKGSKVLGMLTESSRRFERGVDPEGAVTAFWRIVNLLEELAGGDFASEMVDSYPKKIEPISFDFTKTKLESIAGFSIDSVFIEQTLSSLEIRWKKTSKGEWKCTPPSFRPDIKREIDIIEEIIRVYGYDSVSSTSSFTGLFNFENADPMEKVNSIQNILVGLGYRQCINNTFQSENVASFSGKTPVKVMNPLNVHMSGIRTSLLPGILETIDYNVKNGSSNLQLYEIGQIHNQEKKGFEGIVEKGSLCGILHGLSNQKNVHISEDQLYSFYSLKGHLNCFISQLLHLNLNYKSCKHPEFETCFTVSSDDIALGVAGTVSSGLLQTLDIDIQDVFAFIFDLDVLIKLSNTQDTFQKITHFPKIERELNFIFEENTLAGDIKSVMFGKGKGLIKIIEPVNIFRHESLGKGKKSILFNIIFQSDAKTLEDKEVNPVIDEIINVVTNKFSAKLRT